MISIVETVLVAVLLSFGMVVHGAVEEDPSLCYNICNDVGNNNMTTTTTTISSQEIGSCLQRPVSDGGQGQAMAEILKAVHDAAVAANVRPGIGGNATLLAGMNAGLAGSTAPNPEGVAFCVIPAADDDDNDSVANATTADDNNATTIIMDAFYWVPNCAMAPMLCGSLTEEEMEIMGTGGALAYVVDAVLHNNDDSKFHRYVFNNSTFVQTEYQSPTLSSVFHCSTLAWFRTSGNCVAPLAMTCPTMGNSGRNANQIYGSMDTVVVGQQLREGNLAPCLDVADDDNNANNDTVTNTTNGEDSTETEDETQDGIDGPEDDSTSSSSSSSSASPSLSKYPTLSIVVGMTFISLLLLLAVC